MKAEKVLKTCDKGHQFYKSTDCPSCPVCNELNKPEDGFLSLLASPARSALMAEGIVTLEKLAGYTKKEILAIHGMGPKSMPTLEQALAKKGLSFKER